MMFHFSLWLLVWMISGAELFDVQEERPLVPAEMRSPIGTSQWLEFGISISTSLSSCGLLGVATHLSSECIQLDGCSNINPVVDFMKYAVAAWIGGKMLQCVMGCVTLSEPRIIRPILVMISTLFLWAISMIVSSQAHVPISVGFSFLWLGLIGLEASDLALILTQNSCYLLSSKLEYHQ